MDQGKALNGATRRTAILFALVFLFLANAPKSGAQIDPEKRQLIHLGYNAPLQGEGPLAAYGFFYFNKPNFLNHTNITLRAALAPLYVDSEIGFSSALGPNTDLAFGFAGGGYADSY